MPTKMLAKGLTAPSRATPKRQVKLAPEGVVTAIVAVTGVVDEVDDLIVPGAFTHTLSVRRPKVVDDHAWGNRAGRVLHVEEWLPGDKRLPKRTKDGKPWPKEAGALVATMQYNLNSERGRESYEWVRFYAESNEAEFSIGYKVPDGKARKRRDGVRVIFMVDLFEFSHVLFGAAPLSMALDVKSMHSRAGGEVTRPSLTGDDDTTEEYDDVDTDPSKPWDDDESKSHAPLEAKTAASVLLEAKAGGADRNRGGAEHLRRWFLAGADGRIPWGAEGDFRACVAVASEHMSPEDARGYCQLRHKEATGMYTGDAEHLEGKSIGEGKAMSKMKGSYEERIAMLESAAEDLFRVNLNSEPDEPLPVCAVATYANEAVFNVYKGNDRLSYLVPYSADEHGNVDLAEPQPVELSLVAEPDDGGEPQPVDPELTETIVGLMMHQPVESKTAEDPKPEGKAAPLEEDGDTITADNLPEGIEWREYRKTEPIRAVRMDEPFTVATREGVVEAEAGGWLALDSDDYPYPIAADEFENVYEPVDAEDSDDPAEEPNDYAAEATDESEVAGGVEAPADELEEETVGKDTPEEETVTVDPDEHFSMLDGLEDEDADED